MEVDCLRGQELRRPGQLELPRAVGEHEDVRAGGRRRPHQLGRTEKRRKQTHERQDPRDRDERGQVGGGHVPVAAVPVGGGRRPRQPRLRRRPAGAAAVGRLRQVRPDVAQRRQLGPGCGAAAVRERPRGADGQWPVADPDAEGRQAGPEVPGRNPPPGADVRVDPRRREHRRHQGVQERRRRLGVHQVDPGAREPDDLHRHRGQDPVPHGGGRAEGVDRGPGGQGVRRAAADGAAARVRPEVPGDQRRGPGHAPVRADRRRDRRRGGQDRVRQGRRAVEDLP